MRALKSRIVAASIMFASGAVAAHDAAFVDDAMHWNFDAWIVAPLTITAVLFAVGWARLWVRVRRGTAAMQRRALQFATGWLLVALALLSPLHAGGERSFALHMIEHELLMLLAAPLLVMAEPLGILLWAFPSMARRRFGAWSLAKTVAVSWRFATRPVIATILQAVTLWLWHAPALFDLALAHDGWHIAQHASFLVSALLFWTAMFDRRGFRRAGSISSRGLAATCLFATSVVSGALGALMAFSQSPWYEGYARLGMSPFGLTPAEDQQLAGLIMWIPGGLVHALVALVLVRTLLSPARVVPQ